MVQSSNLQPSPETRDAGRKAMLPQFRVDIPALRSPCESSPSHFWESFHHGFVLVGDPDVGLACLVDGLLPRQAYILQKGQSKQIKHHDPPTLLIIHHSWRDSMPYLSEAAVRPWASLIAESQTVSFCFCLVTVEPFRHGGQAQFAPKIQEIVAEGDDSSATASKDRSSTCYVYETHPGISRVRLTSGTAVLYSRADPTRLCR
ncbi:hypothetical protein O181_017785 [Austropuccinia psidii MF-1]|uniref:Uncharacterized protein n=1 Tax=Austropuccinia psidii MF-1 TaxID=1389203 RepID=A0A9Q3C7F0_9BASI|nr:hypothetical protein [Austropuccinia psidii MF-1]